MIIHNGIPCVSVKIVEYLRPSFTRGSKDTIGYCVKFNPVDQNLNIGRLFDLQEYMEIGDIFIAGEERLAS